MVKTSVERAAVRLEVIVEAPVGPVERVMLPFWPTVKMGVPEAEAAKMSVDSVWLIMAAANPRVKLPARLILAEAVAVAPRLTSKVVEKGVKAPELLCQKLVPDWATHDVTPAPSVCRI